ncbi:aminomethyl-transferring glycine dehydrogenase subunit GcvPB [Acidilobus sp.]|uniref:aminomethyl-transferring glycine dehydrogenase subunit GcvPB n=1 Tax=Acidilobus sp. TaxID=1872109 RepID=UPI003CFCA371
MSYRQSTWNEPLIYELDRGRRGLLFSSLVDEFKKLIEDVPIPQEVAREKEPELPEVSEVEVVRHFTRLSEMSYGVDNGPVPLGSCTMKYNPRIGLKYAFDERLEMVHPLMPEEKIQGLLQLLYELQEWLKAITGMDVCTLSPAAGAQGEFTGILIIKGYHVTKGQADVKNEIIIPDSAHGTNPASAAMGGFKVVEIPTADDGNLDYEAFRSALGPQTAGLMLTNPSTLGLFEQRILDVARDVHNIDGLLYYDGANLNGIIGRVRPGDMGFDIAHLNLHKTFSTPHGGGGPGAGPVCIKDRPINGSLRLSDLLPGPVVYYDDEKQMYRVRWRGPNSPGSVRPFLGNVPQLVWAYAYILSLGPQGLRRAGEVATLNTNYFAAKVLKETKLFSLPYASSRPRKHEIVISAEPLLNETGVTAEDVSKYLLDAGLYAPTMYFPLIVKEALMFEFTESETKENIDKYVEKLKEVEELARSNPEKLKSTPLNTSVGRVDVVKANHPRSVTPTYRVLRARASGKDLVLR